MQSADIIELNQLAYRYAAAIDGCDGAALAALFAPNGRLRAYHPGQEAPFADLTGPEQLPAIANAMRGAYRHTMHMMTNHLVDIAGDSASGTVLCTARHLDPDGASALNVQIRYEDRYIRLAGVWKITDRRIRFLWSERHDAVDSGFGHG